jgi:regulator of protease activity HflC (stomatin/prohibitin superfamily)
VGALLGFVIVPFLFAGIRVIKPNEARVLTLFGKYIGTLRNDGIFWVNPFATGVHIPQAPEPASAQSEKPKSLLNISLDSSGADTTGKTRLSLKTMTLATSHQKINDLMGNPIIISIIVIWRVVDTAKAVFNVDNYFEFLSVQSDSALRNIVRKYPYDSTDGSSEGDSSGSGIGGHEKSLRGSSQEIAENLRAEIQEKVAAAGLEISEARITHLAYAPEIAAAMLQRQQASAIVDARSLIVEGAVGMVQAALAKLNDENIVELDEERKAAMVSNLLTVLCANKDAQPVVNSGTIY